MKFAEPLESQRLSFLLEKAASREANMWKVYVPKKVPTQVGYFQVKVQLELLDLLLSAPFLAV